MRTYRLGIFSIALSVAIAFWCFQVTFANADVIIDNGSANTSFTGSWGTSGAADPWDPSVPGATSLWARDGATYTWTFRPTDSGYHDLSMWWTEWPSRSATIPVDIQFWGGTDRLIINQQTNGGQWNFLKSYPFKAGESYRVTITSQPGPTSTNADAVQFVFQPALNVAPAAFIDAISPDPATPGSPVTLTGRGEDIDGFIAQYRWESDRNGYLGNTATLTTSALLAQGVHVISLTVTDNDGAVKTVSRNITIQAAVTEFIIDNGTSQTSYTGSWGVSGASNPWDPANPNATSLWARDGATYTWTFKPPVSANFGVFMWHTTWTSRSSSVPVSIQHANGTDSVIVNQQINGGMWNLLGSYPFEAGVNYRVTITSQPGPSSTCADAVRFVQEGSVNLPPVASIDAITPAAVLPGDTVTFSGSGEDSDGTVEAYEWYSDLDDVLSTQSSFSTHALTPGTHTIFFRVRDDQGEWSPAVVRLVVVRDCDSPVGIMLLGDSITKGVGEIPADDLIAGYRSPLFQRLKDNGYYFNFVGDRKAGFSVTPPFDVDHQGIAGIADNEVADNVYDWLVQNPAEIVLLHIGTNNFSTDPGDVEDILDEIDRYEANFNTEVTVVLAKIINRMTSHPDTTVFNSNLQSVALSRIYTGDKIVIVDQEGALNYATDMWDLLHPKNIGYEKMAVRWLDSVASLLPSCGSTAPFIFSSPIDTATIGLPYNYQVGALGSPAPTYSLATFPLGMTIDAHTGQIAWTPVAGQEGTHAVSVRATNSVGSDLQEFNIDIFNGVIIDNGDPETSFTGSWDISGATDPWDPADPAATSVWGRDGETYTWSFTPPVSGNYIFSMWYTTWSSRSASVPVAIQHAGGTDTKIVNQQINGGRWNAIGTYAYLAGVKYDVTITSQPGPSSTSADAVKFELAAPTSPSITTQPSNQSVIQGSPATFSVTATGTAPLSYQWQKNGVNISGATSASYTIASCTLADHMAQFRCAVTNAAGSVISNAATLSVTAAVAPSITVQPSDQSVLVGATATFSITAEGSTPLSYQWQKNGANISGATSASYTTPPVALGDSGAQFRCVVSNAYGNATSNAATLTVLPKPPVIVTQPANQTVTVGATASFSVVAEGTPPLVFQWQKNGVAIAGATNSAYTTPSVSLSDSGAQFRCVVTNSVGNITSNAATLTVIESVPPVAFNDKADTRVGGSVIINVVANDTDSDGSIDPGTLSVVVPPSNGTASARLDGTVLYTANPGYSGKDTFSYTVKDNRGAVSNVATVTVSVAFIIDNGDPQTSFTGSWDVSGGSNPFDPADSSATSLWARGSDTYTWTFTPAVSGNYEVAMWHTYTASRGTSIPVDISHWGGTDTVYVNQLLNAGKWNTVGTYPFSAGTNYNITIRALPDPYSTCADAVRFVHVPSNVAPLATIGSISPKPALPGQTVTFTGSGVDFEGSVSGYSWYSTLDGPLSDKASFSTATLSEGVHTIFFKVQDNSGAWSKEIQTSIDVNNRNIATTEHIYVAGGYSTIPIMSAMESTLRGLGATYSSGVWTYRNTTRNKTYYIHPVTTKEGWIAALKAQNSHVVYDGHSNYGLGQLFATSAEFSAQVVEDVYFVDDDKIINTSSPVVHIDVRGMRTGQAYPHWWPIFKDGTNAVMPYEKGDPAGPPAYNYYPTYQVPGDPIHYRIGTVRNSPIERFPDWGGPAWYDPSGSLPDPNNPAHDQYFITNTDQWSPSFERTGSWVDTNSLAGFYLENYDYSAAGSGNDKAWWLFDIPTAGKYNVYAWYPAASTNATNAPFTVYHTNGSTIVPVNQRLNGSRWNLIGSFTFDVGRNSVMLSDNATGGNVVADAVRISHVDNPPDVLKASFFGTSRSGPAPLTVTFTSEAIGDVDTFHWQFGDGGENDTRTYVSHTYTQPGTYTVSFTVHGPLGTDTVTKTGYVVVGEPVAPLQAEFECRSSQQALAPATIVFRDRSSGNIVSWQWDFNGDGVIDSTAQSPSFIYNQPGIYDVTLTVKDTNAEISTITKRSFIRVGIYDKNIDNVDYPKAHYRRKTLVKRKELEIPKEELRYARFFYAGCSVNNYYMDTFQQGITLYSTTSAGKGDRIVSAYLSTYLLGGSDYELWQAVQSIQPVYDYYDFRKPPSKQY